ncbi:MAG: hypothetical protein V1860_03820 [bacterium]
MDNRKSNLLNSIIEEYIDSAEPVGSGLIVEKYKLNVSTATVRNEMMELEKEGYIYQPYTSAGRVPTENGYKFYAGNMDKKRDVNLAVKKKLQEILMQNDDSEVKIKNIAKKIAQESNEIMIIAFGAMDIYYTGISNLFAQPEFSEHRLVCSLSEVIDRMDEVIYKCYNSYAAETKGANILIGADNPFDRSCSAIITKFKPDDKDILMCMLGPMRMDYGKNTALVEYARDLMSQS